MKSFGDLSRSQDFFEVGDVVMKIESTLRPSAGHVENLIENRL